VDLQVEALYSSCFRIPLWIFQHSLTMHSYLLHGFTDLSMSICLMEEVIRYFGYTAAVFI